MVFVLFLCVIRFFYRRSKNSVHFLIIRLVFSRFSLSYIFYLVFTSSLCLSSNFFLYVYWKLYTFFRIELVSFNVHFEIITCLKLDSVTVFRFSECCIREPFRSPHLCYCITTTVMFYNIKKYLSLSVIDRFKHVTKSETVSIMFYKGRGLVIKLL